MVSLPKLNFPKHAEITNPQLKYTYYAVMICTSLLLLARFFLMGQMYREVPVGPHVDVSMSVTGHANASGLREVVDRNLASEFCQTPESLDFWWDPRGDYRWDSFQCLPLCEPGGSSAGRCIHSIESYRQEDASTVMLLTELEETVLSPDAGPSNKSFFFVPTTEALGVTFEYSFVVPVSGRDVLPGEQADVREGSSAHDTMTVILDQDGDVHRILPPGSKIRLSVPEMLSLVGRPDLLDSINPNIGENFADNNLASDAGPSMRITGADLSLKLSCYNQQDRDFGARWAEYRDLPLCYVEVTQSGSGGWTSAEEVAALDAGGSKLHRQYHGIRVRISRGGFFYFVDPNNIFQGIIDAIVLLGVPKGLLQIFMCTCLGNLSRIYRRLLYEPFDVIDQVGGQAARFAAMSVQFVELEDQVGPSGPGISRDKLKERLVQTLAQQAEKISPSELENFVDICFKSLTEGHKVADEKRCSRQSIRLDNLINLETFSAACSCNDPIEFDAVIDLFDADRRVSILERLFTPKHIKDHVLNAPHSRQGTPVEEEPDKTDAQDVDEADSGEEEAEHTSASMPMKNLLRGGSTVSFREQSVEERKKALDRINENVTLLVARDGSIRKELELSASRLEALESRFAATVKDMTQTVKAQINDLEIRETAKFVREFSRDRSEAQVKQLSRDRDGLASPPQRSPRPSIGLTEGVRCLDASTATYMAVLAERVEKIEVALGEFPREPDASLKVRVGELETSVSTVRRMVQTVPEERVADTSDIDIQVEDGLASGHAEKRPGWRTSPVRGESHSLPPRNPRSPRSCSSSPILEMSCSGPRSKRVC